MGEVAGRAAQGFPLTYTVKPSTSRLTAAEVATAGNQPAGPTPYQPTRPMQQ